jgi:hypothetical protein
MFGDVATEMMIHTDGDEGLFAGYSTFDGGAVLVRDTRNRHDATGSR